MEKVIIRVSDSNSGGGKVINGSADHTIMGKAIARMGDKVDCSAAYPGGRPHGINPIVEGVRTFTIHGIPVAVDGMKSECGCTLIGSGNATTHVEGAAAVASPLTAHGWALKAAPNTALHTDEGGPTSAHSDLEYGQQFKSLDQITGQPLGKATHRRERVRQHLTCAGGLGVITFGVHDLLDAALIREMGGLAIWDFDFY